jgi:hypothetical protein
VWSCPKMLLTSHLRVMFVTLRWKLHSEDI